MTNEYEYEDDLDILYVKNNPSKEVVAGNLVFGNIVADVGESGKILGVEIDCASKFSKLSAEQLRNLKTAKVEVIRVGNFLTLGIILGTAVKEYTFQFSITNQKGNIPLAIC